VLRDKLFVNRARTETDQDDAESEDEDDQEHLCETDDDEDGDHDGDCSTCGGNVDDLYGSVHLQFCQRITTRLLNHPRRLPVISFSVGFDMDDWIDLPKDTMHMHWTLHPIFTHMDRYMHLIHDSLFRKGHSGESQARVDFTTFDELRAKMKLSENTTEKEDGSWKDMLLCIPPVSWVKVTFMVSMEQGIYRDYKLCAKGKAGVTLGQFVQAFRRQLEYLDEDIRLYPFHLGLYCRECGDEFCCCC
jgi:hypothetical protein